MGRFETLWSKDAESSPLQEHDGAIVLTASKPERGWLSKLSSPGSEEFRILHAHGLQLDTRNDRHDLGSTPSNAWAGFPARSDDHGSTTLADSIEDMALVLRLLIEAFGGEATSTALIKHKAMESISMCGNDTVAWPWLGRILAELDGCGAITLEDTDDTDVVARIAHPGAILTCRSNWWVACERGKATAEESADAAAAQIAAARSASA